MNRLKQGVQVAFVYLFLYGLLFGYVVWTMFYSCGPSAFVTLSSAILVLYTCYSTINFWGEKFILLWIILLLLSLSTAVFGTMSVLDACTLTLKDTGSSTYQWVYQIYFPDIVLLPWIFILGFTSLRYFFTKWRLVRLFFVFLCYNAVFIGIGIFIIVYFILEQHEEYTLIWQAAIAIIFIGGVPCGIFVIYTLIGQCIRCLLGDDDEEDTVTSHKRRRSHSADKHKRSKRKKKRNSKGTEMQIKTHDGRSTTNNKHQNEEYYGNDDEELEVDDYHQDDGYDDEDDEDDGLFDPFQPFTIWVAIQIITSFLDLWSDILYVLISDFYSPYLRIACWIFIFFQLLPDFFVLLQIITNPERYSGAEYDEDDKESQEIVWFPIRRRWQSNSNVLERTIVVFLYSMWSIIMFVVVGTLLILLKIIPLIYVQNVFFQQKCFQIVQIPKLKITRKEDDDDDEDESDTIIDLRMHLIFLLFEVFFQSMPMVAIILVNSHVLLDHMNYVAWISLAVSAYVVLRNIYMFFDDLCLTNRLQRKLYYCL